MTLSHYVTLCHFSLTLSLHVCHSLKKWQNMHGVHWGINTPPKKNPQNITPLISANCPRPPFSAIPPPPPPMYWFFMTPHPTKNRIFQYTPIILKFFILNIFCHLIFHSDFSLFFR